jgi:filamentous hemagglutinin
LQYLNARYYDPELSLFLQPDWFEVTKKGVGTNRFSYSFNDPVNGFDPNGNETCNADGNGCRPDENDPPPCEDSGNCDHSADWLPTAVDIAIDFIPIIGDAKGIYEAEGVWGKAEAVGMAAIGPFGDAIKVARKVGKAAKATSRAKYAPNRTPESYFGQQRRYWTDDPVQFNGNRVYQRNDQFDPGQVSTWRENGQFVQGTNLERMASGRAPIGNDGRPINLHHMTQTQGGAIAEVTQTFHQQNFGTIHINTGSLPSGINRAEFDAWRADYWRNRAGTWGQ